MEAGQWRYSRSLEAAVQIIAEQELWGRSLFQAWIPVNNVLVGSRQGPGTSHVSAPALMGRASPTEPPLLESSTLLSATRWWHPSRRR